MDVADLPLAADSIVAGWALAMPLLALAAWRADFARARDSEPFHVYVAALAALVALWSLRGSVAGFAFHLTGMAGFALATGPARAAVGGALVVAATTWLRDAPMVNAAWVWLTLVALPIATGTLSWRAVERWLPPNFFVYVFAAAFGGAVLALLAGGAAGTVLGVVAGGQPARTAFGEHLPFLLYLAFGEGTLTGMLLTLAVVYRPQWVASFDDRRYLLRR